MPYVYQTKASPIPEEIKDSLDSQEFNVDENMNLVATWDGGEDDPFTCYINADYELIQEV